MAGDRGTLTLNQGSRGLLTKTTLSFLASLHSRMGESFLSILNLGQLSPSMQDWKRRALDDMFEAVTLPKAPGHPNPLPRSKLRFEHKMLRRQASTRLSESYFQPVS